VDVPRLLILVVVVGGVVVVVQKWKTTMRWA
jgi:hypothetical protein